MNPVEITRIDSASSLEALNRSEIDIQISTAKKWPRDIQASIARVESLATVNSATAGECFYSLKRKGKNGSDSVIEGPSVRLAEIVAASWGNLRVSSQIIGNDGKFITARGICIDLETNVGISSDVKRRITDSNGRTFSEDMQVVTGNAAGAIAFRNAVFKVVPKAVINNAISSIKKMIEDSVSNDFEASKEKMFAYFAKFGVTKQMICSYFNVEDESGLNVANIAELRTTATAIKEGQATAKELFIDPYNAAQKASAASLKNGSPAERLAAAKAAQTGEQEENFSEVNTDDLP